MADMKSVDELDAHDKRVLVRVDFNVPIDDGEVSDDTRILAALPTIETLLAQAARVILMSHLGRPAGTGFEEAYSLAPVARRLASLIDTPVVMAGDVTGDDARAKDAALDPGEVLMLENLRFDAREKKNDPTFAAELAAMADAYVDDAFGTAHRAHASTAGVASLLPAYAGYLLENEVNALSSLLDDPARPFVAILGGSKVSDKIEIIEALIKKADTVLIGGAMCFTFIAAKGGEVGASLMEADWVERARDMMAMADSLGKKLLLPVDVVAADRLAPDAAVEVVPADAVPDGMMGLDIGPETAKLYAQAIADAKSVFWNGPLGVFEMEPFETGTKDVACAVAQCAGDTVIGGGDSVAAVNKFGLADEMTFISTGGGASMEFVQGKKLPGIEALEEASS